MRSEEVTTTATENPAATSRARAHAGKPSRLGLRLERRIDGQLWARTGDREVRVKVRRCFPWTEPGRFVSLRDRRHEEVALVRDPGELDARSRAALEDALAAAGFVLEVTRIHAVEEEVEIRNWRVETRQGPRSFQTKRDDWPPQSVGLELPDPGRCRRPLPCARYLRAGPRQPGVAVGVRGVATGVTAGSRGRAWSPCGVGPSAAQGR